LEIAVFERTGNHQFGIEIAVGIRVGSNVPTVGFGNDAIRKSRHGGPQVRIGEIGNERVGGYRDISEEFVERGRGSERTEQPNRDNVSLHCLSIGRSVRKTDPRTDHPENVNTSIGSERCDGTGQRYHVPG